MASDLMTFDVGKASAASSQIDKIGKSIDTNIKTLSSEITKASGWWVGDSSKEFVAKYNANKKTLEAMVTCVGQISKTLAQISTTKQDVEKRGASYWK